jgi:MFS superfamily sulfate permease-like transporter
MVRVRELVYTASRSRLDMLVLIITMIATVALDLISALAIGLVLYLVLRRTRLGYQTPVIDSEETLGD